MCLSRRNGRHRHAGAAGAARLLLAVGAVLVPGPAATQVPDTAQVHSLRLEVERLRAELDSLRALVSAGVPQAPGEVEAPEPEEVDPLARLRAAAEAAAAEAETADTGTAQTLPEDRQFQGRQRSLQALNPEISLNVDVFGRVGSEDPDQQNFYPREFELSFQSALDPFSRAKIFVSRHEPGGEILPFGEHGHGEGGEGEEGHDEGGFAVEEGYLQWVNLPGGLGVKLGRFYQQFGNLNRWHAHALPSQTRSLPHLAFIGEENLSQTGASLYWLVPLEGIGTWETTFEVTRSENGLLFGESGKPAFLGHVNAFWQLTPSTYFDLGVSGIFGEHTDPAEDEAFDQRLFNVEAALNWRPPGRSLYREFTFRGGLMALRPGRVSGGESRESALGFWAGGELKFAQQWLVGAQYGWVEDPEGTDETAWLFAPTLTWWQSEWVRLRAEYDILGRPDETEGQLLLQVTFAMGPHKHETY